MLDRLRATAGARGWTTQLVDPATGERWIRRYLGAEYHGGGIPILLSDPEPDNNSLLDLAASSPDQSVVAASAWLLAETDSEGTYKERLLTIAETAARMGDQSRAALIVGWGLLHDETNLRSTLGKTSTEVSADHDHFRQIAARARALLHLKATDPPLRDRKVFGY
jgi:hypothetical protein